MSTNTSLSDLKTLVEMNKKAQQLVELMKQGIVEFIFKKSSTGKMRTAHGTLDRSLIPEKDRRKPGRPKKRPDYLVIYYDTDKKAIRSFKDFLLQKVNKKVNIISKKSESGYSDSKKEKSSNEHEKQRSEKDDD